MNKAQELTLLLKSLNATSQDVATAFYEIFKNEFVATPLRGKGHQWFQFQSHRWVKINVDPLIKYIGTKFLKYYEKLSASFAYQITQIDDNDEEKIRIQDRIKSISDLTYKLRDISFKEKLIRELECLYNDPTFEQQLNENPNLLGCENGVYELDTGVFRDGKPSDMISLSTCRNYRVCSEEELIDIIEFFKQVFPNEELREFMLTLLASMLYGGNPHEKFYILIGGGGNGKSKMLELTDKAFGMYCAKMNANLFTQANRSSTSSASPEIACLKGIRATYAAEPDDPEKRGTPTLNTGVIKELTGNDKITTRALYGDQFEFKPQFKILFCCNHLPDLSSDDEGTWRRLNVIPFTSRFVKQPKYENEFPRDDYISNKFDKWAEPFIYLLLSKYYPLYLKNGLNEPETVKEATKIYRANVDDIQEFIDLTLTKSADDFITLKDLWSTYKSSDNYNKGLKMKEFKNLISNKLGVDCPTTKTIKGKTVRSPFVGWKFSKDDDISNDNDGGCLL